MLNIKALLRSFSAFASRISRSMPQDRARTINTPTIMKSRATTTIDTGNSEVRATQAGANCGRVNPTSNPPATSLIPNIACSTKRSAVTLDPLPTDHKRNCSIATLANWSNAVEKISVAWQPVAEFVGISKLTKSVCAHRAAKKRNSARTSLRPS